MLSIQETPLCIIDLYALNVEDLVGMELSRHTDKKTGKEIITSIQEKSASNIVSAIRASMTRGLARVIAGLGMGVAETLPGTMIGGFWFLGGFLLFGFGLSQRMTKRNEK